MVCTISCIINNSQNRNKFKDEVTAQYHEKQMCKECNIRYK